MNIREAKEQIEHAVKLYLEKDEKGRYIIPTEKQRPVFLMGAPGSKARRRSVLGICV